MELRDLEYRAHGAINKNISYELSALIDADSLVYGVFDYNRTLIWAGRGSLSEIDSLKEELINNGIKIRKVKVGILSSCLLYTSPSPRDRTRSRMPSSA